MIKLFYGNDRVRALQDISKILGPDYEIIEGINLTENDLPSLLLGNSLFSDSRKILIRDLSDNKLVFEKLVDYLQTKHSVIILEIKLDKRSAGYKALKDKIEIKEYSLPKDLALNQVFDIYNTAKRDGKKAVQILENIKINEDPIMFFGLLVSQAIKDYDKKQGNKEKKVLKELSKLDLELKSSRLQPWLLIESFLLRLSSL